MNAHIKQRTIVFIAIALVIGCTRLDLVRVSKVSTGSATNIDHQSATLNGTTLEVGDKGIDEHGFYLSTNPDPAAGDSEKSQMGNMSGTGSFSEGVTGLTSGTTYYFRAYLHNPDGEVLGEVSSFQTLTLQVPTVTTVDVTSISQTSAVSGGNVTSDGGSTVTTRGVCWNTEQNPTILNSKSTDGNGTGAYISSISGLTCGTTYYVRAYATNSSGTAYGTQMSFTTSSCTADPPTVTTTAVSGIMETVAQGGGNVTDDGGASVTAKGVCWNTSPNPTVSDSKTVDGIGTGGFTSAITGLNCGTTYYVRAYATNESGTSYGAQVSFTSSDCATGVPVVTTTAISSIQETTAQGGGNVSDDGGSTVTSKGVVWSTSQNPTTSDNMTTDGMGTGGFTSILSGLSCGTTYYVRAYATNGNGTAYGDQVSFTTSDCAAVEPTVTTSEIIDVGVTTAVGGGTVTDEGSAPVTARGIVWSTSPDPTLSDSYTNDGSGSGNFFSYLSGLPAYTSIYVRAYATNSAGTAYGDNVNFLSGYVADYETNLYKIVEIGSQIWMAENLRATYRNDGIPLTEITGTTEWSSASSEGYSWYNNDPQSNTEFGAVYNFFAVETGELCPSGWHIPTDDEWKTLETYLGMSAAVLDNWGQRGTDQGTKIKSTSGWELSGNGTDSYGFNGLPAGIRSASGSFDYRTGAGFFWTSTPYQSDHGVYRVLISDQSGIERSHTSKIAGFSVRCIKN